ncbi:hypothetical protein [Ancylobacter koreensis]|nr:hypothetical protein [Ancylobacter koreensis]
MPGSTRPTLYLILLGIVAVVGGALLTGNGEMLAGLLPWRK